MSNLALDIGGSFFQGHPYLTTLTGLSELVSVLSSNLLVIAGVILIFAIVFAGISMISASGDPQAFARARNMLTAAIIGFVLVVSAWLIVGVVEFSSGVDIIQ